MLGIVFGFLEMVSPEIVSTCMLDKVWGHRGRDPKHRNPNPPPRKSLKIPKG